MLATSGLENDYYMMTSPAELPFNANDRLMDTLRRPQPLLDVTYQSVSGAMDFSRLQLGDIVLSLLVQTADFRNNALSYRGFNVGAGAMAAQGTTVGRALGYNVKLDESDTVNIHAEDLVTAKVSDLGIGKIAVLAVIGPTQEDHASGIHTATLHPCGRCRGRLAESPLIQDQTLIVTAKPDFTTIEIADLPGIIALHDSDDDSGITTFHYDETPEVFSPLPEPDERGYITPMEHDIDDTDWQQTVGQHLLARYVNNLA